MPWIVVEWCEGCGECVSKCKTGALELVPRSSNPSAEVSWLTHPDKCVGCGLCESACPWGAIQMTAYVDDAIRRYKTKRP
jgi:ferredoxin